jgi:hypothetical protein
VITKEHLDEIEAYVHSIADNVNSLRFAAPETEEMWYREMEENISEAQKALDKAREALQ